MATLVYRPEGTDSPLRINADPDDMDSLTLEAIEDATGWTSYEWLDNLSRGSVKAVHALLWIALRERTPDLDYSAVRFKMSEVDFEDEATGAAEDPKGSGSAESGTGA